MLVSHDRALLREVCDEFWLVAHGKVEPFDGDLDDYQKWLLEQSRETQRAAREAQNAGKSVSAAPGKTAAAPSPTPSAANREDRKAAAEARQKRAEQVRPIKKEQTAVEARLAKAQAEHDQLLAGLGDAGLSPADRAEQGRRVKALADEIETLEMRWLELGEALDAINAG